MSNEASDAILAHLVGDYVVQTDWMAVQKTQFWLPAVAHAVTYTACFLPLTRDWRRLAVIGGTHLLIDRFRLVRHLNWAKNQIAPRVFRPGHTATGFGLDRPEWLSFWLMVVVDNSAHMLINRAALGVRNGR